MPVNSGVPGTGEGDRRRPAGSPDRLLIALHADRHVRLQVPEGPAR
ncbi:MAG: hypothetical protein M0P22_12225 [Methanoculleus sp.]|nr:hypothetical protein [Methanoculleus sp.]